MIKSKIYLLSSLCLSTVLFSAITVYGNPPDKEDLIGLFHSRKPFICKICEERQDNTFIPRKDELRALKFTVGSDRWQLKKANFGRGVGSIPDIIDNLEKCRFFYDPPVEYKGRNFHSKDFNDSPSDHGKYSPTEMEAINSAKELEGYFGKGSNVMIFFKIEKTDLNPPNRNDLIDLFRDYRRTCQTSEKTRLLEPTKDEPLKFAIGMFNTWQLTRARFGKTESISDILDNLEEYPFHCSPIAYSGEGDANDNRTKAKSMETVDTAQELEGYFGEDSSSTMISFKIKKIENPPDEKGLTDLLRNYKLSDK